MFNVTLYPLPLSSPFEWWAYAVLAATVAVEGPIATLVGAVLAASGSMHPVLVFGAASFGNLSADIGWYYLGYLGKAEWLWRYGSWLRIRREQVERLEKDVHLHAPKLLFMTKITLGLMIPALIATGIMRVPLRRWLGMVFLGECLWTSGLVVIGYYLGQYLQNLELGLQILAVAGGALSVLLLSGYVARRYAQDTNA